MRSRVMEDRKMRAPPRPTLWLVLLATLALGACASETTAPGRDAGLPDGRRLADAGDHDTASGETGHGDGELAIEEGLPDSVWTGTLRYVDSEGADVVAEWRVVITHNSILGEMHNGDQSGFTHETLAYRAPGEADWLDGEQQVVGNCEAVGGTLTCAYAAGQPAQEVIVRVFRQRSLVWERRGQHERLTYEETGVLKLVE